MIGHNAQVAWGFTNLGPDVTDFYVERLDDDKYLRGKKWHELDTREETIKVAGDEPVTITVRSTLHGPIMSDVSDDLATLANESPSTKIE